jgi:CMP-N-acetylneuraminic acid synthetase
MYLENSCLYVFYRETFDRFANRIGAQPVMLEMSSDEAIDIDEEQDFRLAEAVWLSRAGSAR